MLPIGPGNGQVWHQARLVCDVEYRIDEPLKFLSGAVIQRVTLIVPDEHCVMLLDSYELSLVLADGQRHRIPRPLRLIEGNKLECYVETFHRG